MVNFKELKEIVILIESGTDFQTVSNIFNVEPKKIKKYFLKGKKIIERNFDEADAGGGSPGTAAPSQPSSNKWTGASHGRANPIDQNHKWESGINRGKANQLS